MFFTRRQTDPNLARDRAIQRRPTLPSDVVTGRIQDRFAAYDLAWEEIEKYLKRKWPNWSNFNPSRVSNFVSCGT